MLKPNLFIVGAGKSGTTALYEYLRQHPAIFMSEVKEPHYFASDFHVTQSISTFSHYTDELTYLTLFQNAKNVQWLGEASPSNLPSLVAARQIYDFNPDSRIIIILRNPIQTVYAAYYQLHFSQIEPLATFEEALAAQTARHSGYLLPKNLRVHPNLLQYYDVMNFPPQVQRYLDVFPREQVHIIIYGNCSGVL
ncbi:MAG: sulfotransferase [Anaerolineae bacterium]|nr:sulfotransferase [Anaerolineae bacterium]